MVPVGPEIKGSARHIAGRFYRVAVGRKEAEIYPGGCNKKERKFRCIEQNEIW